jgi:hypothetical protein
MGFMVVAVTALVLTLPLVPAHAGRFDHRYPLPPAAPLLAFGAPIATVPTTNLLLGVHVTGRAALPLLVGALPTGVVTRHGDTYTLHQPLLVADGGVLDLTGPATLVLAPGSYLEVGPGGAAALVGLTVRAAPSATTRGFLLDVAGQLVIANDRLESLGRLATLAEGLTYEAATRGSIVRDSTITGNTTGVFVTASSGVRIVGDTVTGSQLDGVELHGDVTHAVVARDAISRSGAHDVELTAGVTSVVVADDRLGPATANGVVLYNHADHDVVRGNHVTGTFDGIELSYVAHDVIAGNVVEGTQRFCVRLTGTSRDNVLARNQLAGCPVGIYVANGAAQNRVLATTFSNVGENVRIRASAPHNVVLPRPTHSELRSP